MSKMPPVHRSSEVQKDLAVIPKSIPEMKIPGRENFDSQGRHGNIKQNTTNQGYQQDR